MRRELAVLLLAFGCADAEPDHRWPDLGIECVTVGATAVDLGAVDVWLQDAPTSRSVILRNDDAPGCGTANITALDIEGDAFSVRGLTAAAVEPGGSVRLDVVFEPASVGRHRGSLMVHTQSERGAEHRHEVQLAGVADGPVLQVRAEQVDFGRVGIGRTVSQRVDLWNVGTQPLVIGGASLFTAQPEALSLDLDPLRTGSPSWVLAPAIEGTPPVPLSFYVDFAPRGETATTGRLVVQHDGLPGNKTGGVFSNDFLDFSGRGVADVVRQDAFAVPFQRPIDIIVAVDRSESMAALETIVGAELDRIATAVAASDQPARAMVVVTDDGCPVGAPQPIESGMAPQAARDRLRAQWDSGGQLAAPGDLTDHVLMLAAAAVSPQNLAGGGCNDSFLLDYANFVVIGISDGGEREFRGADAGALSLLRATTSPVVLHGVGIPEPDGCADLLPTQGLARWVRGTDGVFGSLCELGGARQIVEVGLRPSAEPFVFGLSARPVPHTIEVFIDGDRHLSGWEYDISGGSVVIEPWARPVDGSEVLVRYQRFPDH